MGTYSIVIHCRPMKNISSSIAEHTLAVGKKTHMV